MHPQQTRARAMNCFQMEEEAAAWTKPVCIQLLVQKTRLNHLCAKVLNHSLLIIIHFKEDNF